MRHEKRRRRTVIVPNYSYNCDARDRHKDNNPGLRTWCPSPSPADVVLSRLALERELQSGETSHVAIMALSKTIRGAQTQLFKSGSWADLNWMWRTDKRHLELTPHRHVREALVCTNSQHVSFGLESLPSLFLDGFCSFMQSRRAVCLVQTVAHVGCCLFERNHRHSCHHRDLNKDEGVSNSRSASFTILLFQRSTVTLLRQLNSVENEWQSQCPGSRIQSTRIRSILVILALSCIQPSLPHTKTRELNIPVLVRGFLTSWAETCPQATICHLFPGHLIVASTQSRQFRLCTATVRHHAHAA